MIRSFKYILTIAAAERMMIYRTAKFWVLAGLGLLGILFFMVVMTIVSIVEEGIPGEFLLSGTDAYLALYFFSYIQAVLIIFVAGDFRNAEEKARLDQVMLSRPMTTANWVIGKYLGVVGAVLYLNLFLLLIATIGRTIKAVLTGAAFNIVPFLEYFVIATLPSILFMTAFMFFLVSVFRTASVAILISVAYVASILFYFHHKFLGLFDYGAFLAPVFWSDFIGFGNIGEVLMQRLFFVLLGFALLGLAILLYPRLPQSSLSRRLTLGSSIILLICSILIVNEKVQNQTDSVSRQKADMAYQQKWIGEPACKVSDYKLNVRILDSANPLQIAATLTLANPYAKPLDTLFFALNGGLHVASVKWHRGSELDFKQEHQMLIIDITEKPLATGRVDSILIEYTGNINADDFMLDRLPETKGIIEKSDGPWVQANISAWAAPRVVVLAAESGWYPVPGAAGGYPFETPKQKNFATATIQVECEPDLTPVCQGKKISEKIDAGRKVTTFKVSDPHPGFSLNLAEYKVLSKQMAQTEIQLYVHRKHLLDYDVFSDVADTCFEAVDTILGIFEDVTGVAYPYSKLAIVEVPLQMQIYTNRFGLNSILQQPEVLMIDEITVAGKRFKKEIEDQINDAQREGRDDSPARVKRDAFIEAVVKTFLSDSFWRTDASTRSALKNYITYQVDFQNPLFERALELHYFEESERRVRDIFYPDRHDLNMSGYDKMRQNEWGSWTTRRRYGIEVDTLINLFTRVPLSKIRPEKKGALYRAAVDFKAPPILRMLSRGTGDQEFAKVMSEFVEKYKYQSVTIKDLITTLGSRTDYDVNEFFNQWFDHATFPGYRITQAKAEKIDTGKMSITYQITARVQNGEQGDGFVQLVCSTQNDRIRRNVHLAGFEEKEVRFAVNEEPKGLELVPYFSRNRGKIWKQITIDNRLRRGQVTDTTFSVTSLDDSTFFVLDDQDKGFFTPTSTESKYLRPPSKGDSWWESTNPYAFGKYFFSWRVKRAGRGSFPARWETRVPETGDYEVSFYYRAGNSWMSDRISRTFSIEVESKDGVHPIEIQPESTADGWYPLGRFTFSRDELAVVQLLDEGSGYLVADAVRWEFVE